MAIVERDGIPGKVCSNCGEWKDVSEFTRRLQGGDGYRANCKPCFNGGRREPEVKLTRDHVVPLHEGGSDYIVNIQPLCKTCNCSKGTKTIDYRKGTAIKC